MPAFCQPQCGVSQSKPFFLFAAGFHLGIPLALCHIKKRKSGWTAIREALADSFSKKSEFAVLEEPIHDDMLTEIKAVTNMPLGWPLRIEYSKFYQDLPIHKYIKESGIEFLNDNFICSSEIWICPSGTVLVIGTVTPNFSWQTSRTIDELENIIENHYAEISLIYTQIASVILPLIEKNIVKKTLCREQDINGLRDIQPQKKQIYNSKNTQDVKLIIDENEALKNQLEDILIDIYYVGYSPEKNGDNCIEYVESHLFEDPYLAVYTIVGYSSFLALRWLSKHLSDQSRYLQEQMVNHSCKWSKTSDSVQELKLFRVFCLRFLNEMRPMSIRLQRAYMECLESFWKATRMEKDIDLIDSQLETLESIFSWIDDTKKQTREKKIAFGVIFLTTLSFSSVVASLISTFDFHNKISMADRVTLVSGGCGIVFSIILLIIILPDIFRKFRSW